MRGRLSARLWLLFALFVVYGSTLPFNFTTDRGFVARKFARISLDPTISPETRRRVSRVDVTQNVLLFLPFGVLGVLSAGRERGLRPSRILVVTGLAALLGVAVEAMQLFTLDRIASLTDVLAQAVGACGGAIAAAVGWRMSSSAVRGLDAYGLVRVRTFYPAMIALLVVCVAAWEPFDIALDVGAVASKVRALRQDLWQAGVLSDEGIAALQYALLTMALAAWLQDLRIKGAAWVACMLGVLVAGALEGSQILMSSRMPSLEDATVRAAGAVAGAALWPLVRHGRASTLWLVVLLVATALGAAMQQFSPFVVAETHRPFQWFPFVAAYTRTTFEVVSHDIELLLTYFPLGFCLAWARPQLRRPIAVVIAATLLAAIPIEYFQGWIVGRYPDITDVAWSLAGGWFGVWVARRAYDNEFNK